MSEVRLTDQALGAIMMALQKSLIEPSDIVPVLRDFKFKISEVGLVIMNPPIVKMNYAEVSEENLEDAFSDELTTTPSSTA